MGAHNTVLRKVWCSFERVTELSDDEQVIFKSSPFQVFRPLGLMLFGVTQGMTVTCKISSRYNIDIAHYGTLPALIFGRARSYEQLKKMVEEGQEALNEWASFDTVNIGNIIQVYLKAPRPGMLLDVQVAMWGLSNEKLPEVIIP